MTPADFPWLAWPQTQRLIAIFRQRGADLCFTGGAIRDAILGRTPFDIDCVSTLPAEKVLALLQEEGIEAFFRHRKLGLVVFEIDGVRFDIASLDGHTDAQKPFHARVLDTVSRYDFTLNAFYLTPEGECFDPFGGREDALAGRVRFISEAETYMHEYPISIVRYLRFQAQCGSDPADPALLALCLKHSDRLKRVAPWRRAREILKLALTPRGVEMLEGAEGAAIFTAAMGFTLKHAGSLRQAAEVERMAGHAPDLVLRALVLSRGAGVPAKEALASFAEALMWSAENLAYYGWIFDQMERSGGEGGTGIRKEWRAVMGEQGFRHLVLLRWSLEKDAASRRADYLNILDRGPLRLLRQMLRRWGFLPARNRRNARYG